MYIGQYENITVSEYTFCKIDKFDVQCNKNETVEVIDTTYTNDDACIKVPSVNKPSRSFIKTIGCVVFAFFMSSCQSKNDPAAVDQIQSASKCLTNVTDELKTVCRRNSSCDHSNFNLSFAFPSSCLYNQLVVLVYCRAQRESYSEKILSTIGIIRAVCKIKHKLIKYVVLYITLLIN